MPGKKPKPLTATAKAKLNTDMSRALAQAKQLIEESGTLSEKLVLNHDKWGGQGVFVVKKVKAGEVLASIPHALTIELSYDPMSNFVWIRNREQDDEILKSNTDHEDHQNPTSANAFPGWTKVEISPFRKRTEVPVFRNTTEATMQMWYLNALVRGRHGNAQELQMQLDQCPQAASSAQLAKTVLPDGDPAAERRWVLGTRGLRVEEMLKDVGILQRLSNLAQLKPDDWENELVPGNTDPRREWRTIYPLLDFVNHAMVPNLVAIRNEESTKFVALTNIKKHEELTMHYVPQGGIEEMLRYGFFPDSSELRFLIEYHNFGYKTATQKQLVRGAAMFVCPPGSDFCPVVLQGPTRTPTLAAARMAEQNPSIFQNNETSTVIAHALRCPVPDTMSLRHLFGFAKAVGEETRNSISDILRPSIKAFLAERGLIKQVINKQKTDPFPSLQCFALATYEAAPVLALARYLNVSIKLQEGYVAATPELNSTKRNFALTRFMVDDCAGNIARVVEDMDFTPETVPSLKRMQQARERWAKAQSLTSSGSPLLLVLFGYGGTMVLLFLFFCYRKCCRKKKTAVTAESSEEENPPGWNKLEKEELEKQD
ncbi:unnamed protein product [Amoebophrya sp. A120]|nr:unnamed protein product [Amoebophrya sp. A120]|eukprot:GSA120T00005436001.1